MYNDYARPWRRFPCALMLLIALSAASCRTTQKQTTEEYSHEETSDTMAASAKGITLMDWANVLQMNSTNEVLWWHLLTYDTSLPADPQTGRSPVKAEVLAHATRQKAEREKRTALRTETLRTVVVRAAGNSQGTRTSKSAKTHKAVPWTRIGCWLLPLFILALLFWLIRRHIH